MNLSRKILAALMSLALITMMGGPIGAVQAEDEPTVASLMLQIDSLNDTIRELTDLIESLTTGGTIIPTPTTGGAITGIPSDFTFQTNLKLGSAGDDAQYLQIVLNSDVETQLAVSGVGSAGNETSYFGPLTKAAAVKFQEKYIDDILTPLGLTTATGFVGPSTRAKLNGLLAVAPGPGPVVPAVLSITSVAPESDAMDVAIDITIGATFSEGLSLTTVTSDSVYVTDADAQAVVGSVSYDSDTQQAIFVPEADLADSTVYTVTLTTDIQTADGTALVEDASWSFTTVAPEFTGLGISLSDDTPDARGVAYNESGVVYTTLTATASEEDVEITGLTIDRAGLGRYQDFDKIYAVVDGVRHGSKRVLGSDNTVDLSFSGTYSQITILDGETKEIEIVADMDAFIGTPLSGDMNALVVSAIETSSVIEGDLPIVGNALTVTSIAAPTADFSYEGDSSDVTVGEGQATVGEFTLANSSDSETISFISLNLKQSGSADNEEVINYTLYDADTDEAIAPVVDADNSDQIIFILDEAIELEDGKDVDLEVKADIEDGEGQTVILILDESTDLVATGADHGFTVLVTPEAVVDASVTHDIIGGALTIDESDDNSNAQTIAPNTDSVTFLTADFEAEEGTVLVTSLRLDIAYTGTGSNDATDLDNITLYRDGTKVAGPLDYDDGETAFVFDEDFEISDSQVITVEIDVTDDAEALDVYNVEIDSATITAERLDGTDVDATDIVGTATGKKVTVSTGVLTLAQTSAYGDQNVVAGSDDVKIGSFVLQAGSAEDIKIQKYTIDFNLTGLSVGDISDISNLKLGSKIISSPKALNNIFTINETLAADATTTVDVYADVDSDLVVEDSFSINFEADLEGVSSKVETLTDEDGQTITIADTGLTVAVSSSTPDADIILATTEDTPMATYTFSAVNEDYTVTDLKVTTIAEAMKRDITGVYLKWGDETSTTVPLVVNVASFTGLDIDIPADEDVDISVYANLNKIGSGYADSGDSPLFQLTYYKAESDTRAFDEDNPTTAGTAAVPATGTVTITNAVGTVDRELDLGGVPEITNIVFVGDVGDDLNEKYFTITKQDTTDVVYGFWFDVDGDGGTDPNFSDAGITGVKITTVATDDDAQTVAGLVATAINDVTGFGAAATANTHMVTVTNLTDGAVADATIGDAGVVVSVVVQGSDSNPITLPYGATVAQIATAIDDNMTSVSAVAVGAGVTLTALAPGLAGNIDLLTAIDDYTYYKEQDLPALTLEGGLNAEFQLDTISPVADGVAESLAVYNIQINDGSVVKTFTVNESDETTTAEVINAFVVLLKASSLPVTARNVSDTSMVVEADVAGTVGGFTSSVWMSGTVDGSDAITLDDTAVPAVDAVTGTKAITIALSGTTGLELTLNINDQLVTLVCGETAAQVATKVADAINAGPTATATSTDAVVDFTATAVGADSGGTLAMANATYYSGDNDGSTTSDVPTLTLANGVDAGTAGLINGETMVLRKAKPIIGFATVEPVDTATELASGQTRKIYKFTISSSDETTKFELSTVKLYVSGNNMTLNDAKIYDAADTGTALDEANETLSTEDLDTSAENILTFDGLTEKISTEKTYYVEAGFAGVDADDKITISYYNPANYTGFAWLDDDDVVADASLLSIPTDSVTLDESL